MNNNFLKSNRLLNKSDFQGLRSGSRFFASEIFVYYVKSIEEQASTRLGIAIPKRFGNACKRNRIKRKIRESFRNSEFKNSGVDVLVTINFKNISRKKISPLEVDKLITSDFTNGFNIFLNS